MTGRTPAGPEVQYIRPHRKFERVLTESEKRALETTKNVDYGELERRTLSTQGISLDEFMSNTPWKKR